MYLTRMDIYGTNFYSLPQEIKDKIAKVAWVTFIPDIYTPAPTINPHEWMFMGVEHGRALFKHVCTRDYKRVKMSVRKINLELNPSSLEAIREVTITDPPEIPF